MAYADQGMSKNRMMTFGIVAVLHVLMGYLLVSGLALKAVKAIVQPLESVNIKEEAPPPDEPPPPPPKDIEIPPYVPPPEVSVAQEAAPTITTQTTVPAPEPPRYTPPAPPAPPAPTGPTSAAQFDPRSLAVSEDDYPPSSLRAEEEGLVKVKVTIGVNGRVTACEVAATSGFPKLDEKSCRLAMSRWRSKPALQNGTPVESSMIRLVRWQITTK